MKAQWLHLNTLDTVSAVHRYVLEYVTAYNAEVPHTAFQGQTPDEMYFGTGDSVPETLQRKSNEARRLLAVFSQLP